jgi:hypothetical protein
MQINAQKQISQREAPGPAAPSAAAGTTTHFLGRQLAVPRIGLGLAALGRPGYINLGILPLNMICNQLVFKLLWQGGGLPASELRLFAHSWSVDSSCKPSCDRHSLLSIHAAIIS